LISQLVKIVRILNNDSTETKNAVNLHRFICYTSDVGWLAGWLAGTVQFISLTPSGVENFNVTLNRGFSLATEP